METSSLVQVHLKAKNEDELVIAMFKNNAKHSAFFKYSTHEQKKDHWITWYYIDILKFKLRLKDGVRKS